MEYLTEHHRVLAEAHLQTICARLQLLKDSAPTEVRKILVDSVACGNYILKIEELKSSNLFAAEQLCQELISRKADTSHPLTPLQVLKVQLKQAEVRLALGPITTAVQLSQDIVARSSDYQEVKYEAEVILGHALKSSGDIIKAKEHYKKAEILSENMLGEGARDRKVLASIFQQLCTYSMGHNAEALSNLSSLVSEESLSKKTEGILKQGLGNIYRSVANWRSAISFFKESIKLADDAGDVAGVAERTAELGRVYRSSGQYQLALDHQKQLYDHALSRGDIASLAAACGYIGFTNYSLSQASYDTAIMYLAARLSLSDQLEDRQGFRWCLNNIGKCYLNLEHANLAFELFKLSGSIAKELNDLLGEGTAYGNMGTACRALKRHKDAVTNHLLYAENAQKRLDIGGVAIMQRELALDYTLLGDFSSAQKYALLALQTGLEIRARLAREDDVLKIANFEKNQANTYAILQYVLVNQGFKEAALIASEMGRAQALTDLVERHAREPSHFFSKMKSIVEADGSLSHEVVAEVMASIADLLGELSSHLVVYSLVEDPCAKNKELSVYIWLLKARENEDDQVEVDFRSKPLDFKDGSLQSDLSLDQDYFNSLKREVGVVDTSFLPLTIHNPIPPTSALEETALVKRDIVIKSQSRRKQISDHNEDKLSQLYKILVSPIEHLITRESKTPRIIFVPQGQLFNVPFPALRGPRSFLIEQFVISISPSIYLLHRSISKAKSNQITKGETNHQAFVVGNPKMPLHLIPQLPGAESEAKSIHSILGGKLLCGPEATKAEVVANLPNYNIAHLATHAILEDTLAEHLSDKHGSDKKDGDYSIKGAVVLAKSDETCSGVLTSTEIQKMILKNELVVLSCCRTGCGKVTGDGILGLSRSIISAGAHSLIVTLWSIHDDSTATLMEHFYLAYKECRDAPYSLRKAMLHLIEKGYSPLHWGAFCIQGISPNIVP